MEIYIGQKAQASRQFSKEIVQAYANLTGDFNPVHFDENYAKNTIFKKPIVHGPLVLTLVTTLFANELPGSGSVYLSHDLKFLLPVYYDEIITAIVEVIDVNQHNHIVLKTVCLNQKDEVVISGIAKIKKF